MTQTDSPTQVPISTRIGKVKESLSQMMERLQKPSMENRNPFRFLRVRDSYIRFSHKEEIQKVVNLMVDAITMQDEAIATIQAEADERIKLLIEKNNDLITRSTIK